MENAILNEEQMLGSSLGHQVKELSSRILASDFWFRLAIATSSIQKRLKFWIISIDALMRRIKT